MTLSSHDARLSWTQLGVHMGCTAEESQLNCGRKLIALEDTLGTGSYLLDLDTEAIYVLAEFSHPLTHQQHRVA